MKSSEEIIKEIEEKIESMLRVQPTMEAISNDAAFFGLGAIEHLKDLLDWIKSEDKNGGEE